ncbi:MAG TPA: PQQ-dependent sugar dehydrogenase [Steroidobacteraceae bacterium]|nr:PQQ-dependent sugar dehydrogenase [Steroidobacteraceae bacterium]
MLIKSALASSLFLFASVAAAATATPQEAPHWPYDRHGFELANQYCMSCHGQGLTGGRAPPLIRGDWIQSHNEADYAQVIAEGRPANGMPAFKNSLSKEQIDSLAHFIATIQNFGKMMAEKSLAGFDHKVFDSELEKFSVEVLASELETPWSFAFLPDGGILFTERPGRLRVLDHGKVSDPIVGLPQVWARQDGGLMSLALHPDYAHNGWIYLAFAEPGTEPGTSMTKIVRGRIKNGHWVDQQDIWVAKPTEYFESNIHFGSRLLFVKGKLFFSIGDRGHRDQAQRVSAPFGKVFRVNDDGSIPADNPFAHQTDAVGAVWTYGHRNPQGLGVDPRTGVLWETEHGPKGGDELNALHKGANYGWPLVTHGVDDDGSIITNETSRPGLQDPATFWVPSISPTAIEFYSGDKFQHWRNQMLIGSLTAQDLIRIQIDGERVVKQEVLVKGMGRIRDIHTGPDGYIYIAIERFGKFGQLVRLVPAN